MNDLNEKDQCIYEIGNVVLNFGRLEYTFKTTLPYISKVSGEEFTTLSARLSFRNVVELFGDFTLLKYKDNKTNVKEIKSLIKKAYEANDLRNDLLHSYWYNNPVDKHKPLYKYRMRKNYADYYADEMIPFGLTEIKAVSDKITSVYKELVLYMKKYYADNFR